MNIFKNLFYKVIFTLKNNINCKQYDKIIFTDKVRLMKKVIIM